MKKLFIIQLLLLFLFLGTNQLNAQTATPPPPPGNGSSGNQTSGGGAPIGSGLFILLGLGITYGSAKGYKYLTSDKDDKMES